MGNQVKTEKQDEQLFDENADSSIDEMNEIEKFIRKKRFQNQVLEKFTRKIDPEGSHKEEKPENP